MSSRSSVISVGVTVSAVVSPAKTNYHGYTLYNAGATAAVVTIYDNASAASGTILDTVVVPATGSANAYYSVEDNNGGIRANNGVYFSTTATVAGSVRIT